MVQVFTAFLGTRTMTATLCCVRYIRIAPTPPALSDDGKFSIAGLALFGNIAVARPRLDNDWNGVWYDAKQQLMQWARAGDASELRQLQFT